MHIQSLSLSFFRNYEYLQLAFARRVNAFSGKNGAGKTNILDALHFLSFTKGFRSSTDKQAVKEGEGFFFINGQWRKQDEVHEIQCNFLPGKGKKIILDGVPLEKFSTHIGDLPLVSVLPSDTALITGSSSLRREFMDTVISQYNPYYLQQLIQYKKILEQRNALLKTFGEQRYFDTEQLQLWTMPLIPLAQAIQAARTLFLEKFTPFFVSYFHTIVSQSETPSIVYQSETPNNTTAEWEKRFQESETKDRVLQTTSAGIHKEDLVLSINGTSAKHYGSQGQQKTFVISLKLAEYSLLAQEKQLSPLLLLDDIFDKLDEFRLQKIAHILSEEIEGQVFITDTSHAHLYEIFGNKNIEAAFFAVENGIVTPIKNDKKML